MGGHLSRRSGGGNSQIENKGQTANDSSSENESSGDQSQNYGQTGTNKDKYVFTKMKPFEKYLKQTPSHEADKVRTVTFRGEGTKETSRMLPEDVSRFDYLTSLTITHLDIEEFDHSFKYLDRLQHLDLSHNRISEIPVSFFSLVHLETLNLAYNRIEGLPTKLLMLKKMKTVNVEGNETIVCPPYDISIQGWEAIKDFLSQSSKRNVWKDSRLFYLGPAGGLNSCEDDMDSLFSLTVEVVLKFELDFLSPAFIAPRMKTFLTEKEEDFKRRSIQVAKCATCDNYFSNTYQFRGHTCS